MKQSKLGSFVVLLVLLCAALNGRTAASNPLSTLSDEGDQPIRLEASEPITDRILTSVFTLTNLFLEKVVQRNRLTKMVSEVEMSTVYSFIDSLSTSRSKWATYLIGFVILFLLFLLLAIGTLVFNIVYLVCHYLGKCAAAGGPEKAKPSSKACTIGCSVALALVAMCLIVGGVAMFATNEKIKAELNAEVIDSLLESVDLVLDFVDSIVLNINDTIFGGFVRVEDTVIGALQEAPMKATQSIANSTRGVVNSFNQLKSFTAQLDTLKTSFISSHNLTQGLSRTTSLLTDALNGVGVKQFLDVCQLSICDQIKSFIQGSSSGGFSLDSLNIGSALKATSDSHGLDSLVDSSLQQLNGIQFLMNSTVALAISGLKVTTKGVKLGLSLMINNLNKTIRGVVNLDPVRGLLHTVTEIQMYKLISGITYWGFLVLASIVVMIVLLDLLGLVMGLCLPSNHEDSTSGARLPTDDDPTSGTNRCGCTKCIGSRLLKTGVTLTLVFYWVFALLAACLFFTGGPIHTEVCRNIVQNDHPDSSPVLSIFDEWVVGYMKLSPVRIRPFKVYSVCQEDRPIVEAIELTQLVNMSQINSTIHVIESIVDVFKGVPSINIAGPDLGMALGTLTSGLGASSLNFTQFYSLIGGNDLINTIASALNNSDISVLKKIYQENFVPLLQERDQLLASIKSAEAILSQISFSNITKALANAGAIMKNAIPNFLNSTTNAILVEIETYVTEVAINLVLKLGRCRLIYVALNTVVEALCVDLLNPINGYLFSLGWCTLFLIPNVFLSLYLASVFNEAAPRKPVDV